MLRIDDELQAFSIQVINSWDYLSFFHASKRNTFLPLGVVSSIQHVLHCFVRQLVGKRATTLPLCFQLLGTAPPTEPEASSTNDASPVRLCPLCGGPMRVIERLTAEEIQLRSPPARHTVAA
jgi:hypothetical protein